MTPTVPMAPSTAHH